MRLSFDCLPRAVGKPPLDHREPITPPKRLAIDEDPGRTEYTAADCIFTMTARNGLDLGIGDPGKDQIGIDAKRRAERGDCLRIVSVETVLEVFDDDILCKSGRRRRVFALEVIEGTNSGQTDLRMVGGRIERHIFQPRQTLPIMSRFFSLQRRSAEALGAGDLEGGAQRKGAPQYGSTVALGEGLDLERREVGIARRKVEPKFERRAALLRRR